MYLLGLLQVRESSLEKLLEQSNMTPHKEVTRLEEERLKLQKHVEVHTQQHLLVLYTCVVREYVAFLVKPSY